MASPEFRTSPRNCINTTKDAALKCAGNYQSNKEARQSPPPATLNFRSLGDVIGFGRHLFGSTKCSRRPQPCGTTTAQTYLSPREFPASSPMNTGSKMVYRDLKFKPGHSTNISVALVLLASIGPAGAFGFTFSNGGPGEYSYPADPQYQLEPRGRAHKPARKCPKGHALWQGKCRIALPVYPSR